MKSIYTLSIKCVSGRYLSGAFSFVLELPADSMLDDLASEILDVVDFDGDHLSDFYLANSLRGKRTWFTPDGEWDPDNSDIWDRRLCDIYPLDRNKKLYYAYDAGASWRFEIVKKGKEKNALAGQEYPHVVAQEGVMPLEYGPDEDAE
ncbi:MAG: hypothetical protein ABIQ08_13740 [Duganella sp.]